MIWQDSSRIFRIAAAVVGLLALLGGVVWLLGIAYSHVRGLNDRLQRTAASVQAAQEKIASSGERGQQLAEMEYQLAEDDLKMDWEVRRGLNFYFLGKLAAAHALTLVAMEPQNTQAGEYCLESGLDISLRGEYDQLLLFIRDLAQEMPNATIIRSLSLTRDDGKSVSNQLVLSCQLVTFLKEHPGNMRLNMEWASAESSAFSRPFLIADETDMGEVTLQENILSSSHVGYDWIGQIGETEDRVAYDEAEMMAGKYDLEPMDAKTDPGAKADPERMAGTESMADPGETDDSDDLDDLDDPDRPTGTDALDEAAEMGDSDESDETDKSDETDQSDETNETNETDARDEGDARNETGKMDDNQTYDETGKMNDKQTYDETDGIDKTGEWADVNDVEVIDEIDETNGIDAIWAIDEKNTMGISIEINLLHPLKMFFIRQFTQPHLEIPGQ